MVGYGRLWPGARAADRAIGLFRAFPRAADRGHRAFPGISASAVIAGVAVMAEAELRPSGPTRTGLAWRIRPTWRIRYALGYQRLRIGRILRANRAIPRSAGRPERPVRTLVTSGTEVTPATQSARAERV